jgi:hypothetical protein
LPLRERVGAKGHARQWRKRWWHEDIRTGVRPMLEAGDL